MMAASPPSWRLVSSTIIALYILYPMPPMWRWSNHRAKNVLIYSRNIFSYQIIRHIMLLNFQFKQLKLFIK